MPTAPSAELTLRDVLSRLTHTRARTLLGPRGEQLLREGGRYDVAIDHQARLGHDRFELVLGDAVATIRFDAGARHRVRLRCSSCDEPCEHLGAVLSLILEEKLELGLAAPPAPRSPVESLDEDALVRRAVEEREERARTERMTCRSTDPRRPWTDYLVTSHGSGKSYRVALRGEERGESFCSCPDFRKNTLGTCKHVLHALEKVRRRFPATERRRAYRRTRPSLHLEYGDVLSLRLRLPHDVDAEVERIARPFADVPITKPERLVGVLGELDAAGCEVQIYPDAEEFLERRLQQRHLQRRCAAIRRVPAAHRLRQELLQVELLPYQLDGIAFAASARRAILADDMGLGKTIQGIGVAELLAREVGIRKVLVVCPASVKSQWRTEIERFCARSAQVVLGSAAARARQYADDAFFTICNYEQVLRDVDAIEGVGWDLIVLDEAQRIKNWEAKTSAVIKSLRSKFALALTGTPLENRLDDLYSVVEFIDDRRLGPAFRFFNRHRVVDENGKVLGYKNLDDLRDNLAPVLLRRTRASVARELPPRTTEIVRIEPTEEQLGIHTGQMRIISSIVRKPYLTEMDLLRLRKALLVCRMVANGTYQVDKQRPSHSSKLDRLAELLGELLAEDDRKIVLFSEWTTMLDEIEPIFAARRAEFVRLDGKVPQARRRSLVERFRNDRDCRAFLTTNAGATGLNLQAANTVVNVDLPWNPAVLEQRIGRAHRMGQKRPVQVYVLVTEETIEESLLKTLGAKQELFCAALDPDSEVASVDLESGMEELRRRLEVLLGRSPDAPLDGSNQIDEAREIARREERERVAVAGGRLVAAAFEFLDEIVPPAAPDVRTAAAAARMKERLFDCLERDADGRLRLAVTLPDETALDRLASSLARIAAP